MSIDIGESQKKDSCSSWNFEQVPPIFKKISTNSASWQRKNEKTKKNTNPQKKRGLLWHSFVENLKKKKKKKKTFPTPQKGPPKRSLLWLHPKPSESRAPWRPPRGASDRSALSAAGSGRLEGAGGAGETKRKRGNGGGEKEGKAEFF